MSTGYTRQSAGSIITGNPIQASDSNNEFNQLAAFANATTGHAHDGTTGGGAPITSAALTSGSITGLAIDNSIIGGSTPAAATITFFNLADCGVNPPIGTGFYFDFTNGQINIGVEGIPAGIISTQGLDSCTIGSVTPAQGFFTTIQALSIDGTPIGANTPSSVVGTTIVANSGFTGTLTGAASLNLLKASNLSDVANATTALTNLGGLSITTAASTYAPLASPTFTGTVTAPTFVGALTGAASANLLKTNNLSDVANAATALSNLAGAPLASPTFTGAPTLPTGTIATTQSTADSSTKIATTAYVQANLSSYLTTTSASSTYAPLASPTLTGTPLAPTATALTNTTQIASTAFVKNQGLSYSTLTAVGTNTSLTTAALGSVIDVTSSTITITLPPVASCPAGSTITFVSDAGVGGVWTLKGNSAEAVVRLGTSGNTATITNPTSITAISTTSKWIVYG